MSIMGQSFNNDTTGSFITVSAGSAAPAFTGGFTVAILAKTPRNTTPLFGAYSGAVATNAPDNGALHLSGGAMFSINDFTSGFGTGLGDNVWRWYVISKPAGPAHFRMHYADLATLTWAHGEAAGAANQGNKPTSANFTLGLAYSALGFESTHLAAGAVWNASLSDAAIQAACTKLAANLKAANPAAAWLLKQSAVGAPGSIVDFTGGGANEAARNLLATSPDPTDYDFTLVTPNTGSAAFAETIAIAAAGRAVRRGGASFAETVALAASGVTAKRGSAAFGVAMSLAAVGGDPATIPRADSEAGLETLYRTGLSASHRVGLEADYEVGIAWDPS